MTEKTYKVWIELERWDKKTDTYTSLEGDLSFSSTAEFDTLEEAEQFANRLDETGRMMSGQ